MKAYFFLILIWSFASETLAQSANEWFEKGMQASKKRNYQEAMNCYVNAVKLGFKADFYHKKEKDDTKAELEKYRNRMENLDTANVPLDVLNYWHERGKARIHLNDYQNAVIDFERVIKFSKGNDSLISSAYYHKVIANTLSTRRYYGFGCLVFADDILMKYLSDIVKLSLAGNSIATAILYDYHGTLNNGKENYFLAIKDFDIAIGINSACADFYNNRAVAKYNFLANSITDKEDYKKYLSLGILADFDKAIQLDSSNAEMYYNRATFKYHLAKYGIFKYKDTREDFKKVLKLDPHYHNSIEILEIIKREF